MSLIVRNNWRLSSRAFGLAAGVMGMAAGATAADLPGRAPEPVFDQERFNQRPVQKQTSRKWSLIIGGGGEYEPEYEGSGDFEIGPVPLVLLTYGEWLQIDPKGVTVTPVRHSGFSLSGKVGYESGRDADDYARLRGLGDIDFAATVGLKAAYKWGPLEFYATVDQTIDGSESLIGTLGIGYSAPVTEKLILGAKAEAIVANDKHMEAYFGVNAMQAAASGLPEYKAKAGLKRINVSASATYLLDEHWLVRGQTGLGILAGDAADSPIVEKKLQPSVSAVIGYRF
ncbi:outer membrane scaffolding protein for murein synthesis (MipA/OmpV family) [Chelatococcus caeni]|uniref:Outer membrane scaffolding protein for murein synthesis (MipA/OmpV family) n=1 Tax=Chelatococcus caeni TaxID=1348468 RepID=A0A840C3N3_9HYPH|nr:MipA/OmpV family protein [Chelatococcus caeni]MBB4019453.1 outer membrane scaffolding protein for murein synthesis (MipA/OmpV family) [Chelatococcus caeni]